MSIDAGTQPALREIAVWLNILESQFGQRDLKPLSLLLHDREHFAESHATSGTRLALGAPARCRVTLSARLKCALLDQEPEVE
jgi:hypothetical protein